jgi:hypothetical protein
VSVWPIEAQRICSHISDAKIIRAGLDRNGSSRSESALKQGNVLLFVLGDEKHIVEEVFIKAGKLKVGLREALQSFLVEDVLQMFQLARSQSALLVVLVEVHTVKANWRMSRSRFSWRLAIPTGMALPMPMRTGKRAREADFILATTVDGC